MEQVVATISNGDTVLAQDVTAWVQVTSSQSGLRSWRGSFVQPQGSYVPVGGPYLLKTGDGRSGQILVTRTSVGSHQATRVEFTGTGPFG
jgi:hypothetical protein